MLIRLPFAVALAALDAGALRGIEHLRKKIQSDKKAAR